MKKTVLIIIFFLSLFHINAQQKDFKKTLQEIEHLLYFPDTALFDDELIRKDGMFLPKELKALNPDSLK